MRSYEDLIRKEARGVVAEMFSGGSKWCRDRGALRAIAYAYGVSPTQVDQDIHRLLDDPEFMRQATGRGRC